MISLIVPTMWIHSTFVNFLKQLVDQKSIGEIIIINNNVTKTPDAEILKHPKVKLHNCQKNIFVVPAWNLGASIAQHSILGFLADDVEVNVGVFDKVAEFINSEIGMIGLLSPYFTENFQWIYERFLTDDTITFSDPTHYDEAKRPPTCGIGNLFFVMKENWVDIPSLKIFHGEILQWNRLSSLKKNYIITNCSNKTPWNVTWKHLAEVDAIEFNKIQIEDQRNADMMHFTFSG